MRYRCTKTYGHDLGLSCAFRQWRAESHCRFLHGYALSFELVFEADDLDACNWVIDFGGLKPVKQFLCDTFDHKLVAAQDDPHLDALFRLAELDVLDVLVVRRVGCEAFANLVANWVTEWLSVYNISHQRNVRLVQVECREHGANSATVLA